MLHTTINIPIDYSKLGIEHNDVPATITTYVLESYPEYQNPKKRPVVVICPGGGYGHHSPREGEAIAIQMNRLGYHAVILRYSLAPNEFPCALYELAWTVDYVRKNADEWDANPDRVIACGFSAGGHVAASLGTMYDEPVMEQFLEKVIGKNSDSIKPNGLLLGYPVLTSGQFAHRGSFEKLLGTQYEQLVDYVSLENRVNKNTPKTFLWHTCEDKSVPLENTLRFACALRENGVPFEVHIFPKGSHGLGLGTQETNTKDGTKYQPECAVWTELFGTWVENNIV